MPLYKIFYFTKTASLFIKNQNLRTITIFRFHFFLLLLFIVVVSLMLLLKVTRNAGICQMIYGIFENKKTP